MKYQLLPALSADEYERLRADIGAHGIRQPIELDENGDILDGHHRKAIADELCIDCPSVEVALEGEVARRAYVLRVNLNRRQLTSEQQKSIRQRQKEIAMEMNEDHTQQEIGDALGVARETIRDWLTNNGGPANVAKSDHRKRTSPEKVAEVLAGLGAGKSQDEIAKEVGVAQTTVSNIKFRHGNGTPRAKPKPKPAAKPLTKTHRGRKVIDGMQATVDMLVGLASGLDGVSVTDAEPEPDVAAMWEKELAAVMSSIRRFRTQIKEYQNGQ